MPSRCAPRKTALNRLPPQPPQPPTGFAATGQAYGAVLSWTGVAGAISYSIRRTTHGGSSWTTVATGVTGLSYTDQSGLTPNTAYDWQIQVATATGTSGWSLVVTATTTAPQTWVDPTKNTYTDTGLTTPATADGATVLGYKDASGNANNFLDPGANHGATLKLSVVNGRSILRFNGTNQVLNCTTAGPIFRSSNPFTINLIASQAGNAAGADFLNWNTSSSSSDYGFLEMQDPGNTPNSQTARRGNTTGDTIHDNVNPGNNVFAWVRLQYNGATFFLSTNGDTGVSHAGSANSSTTNQLTIGALIRPGAGNGTIFNAGDLGMLEVYNYALSASEIIGQGAYNYSIFGLGISAPSAPTSPSASPGANVLVSWTPPAGVVTSYSVQRSPAGVGSWATMATGITAAQWQDNGVVAGQSYDYQIAATNPAGTSAWTSSATVQANVPTGFNRLAGASGRVRLPKASTGGTGTAVVADVKGTVTSAPGRLGPCAAFDGSSAAAMGLNTGFDITPCAADWTLSVDFYVTAFAANGIPQMLLAIDRADQGVRQLNLYVELAGGTEQVRADFWTSGSGGGNINLDCVANLALNTWYTAVLRYSASAGTYALSCNGVTATSAGSQLPIYYDPSGTHQNCVQIGGNWDNNNGWRYQFTGRMENLRCHLGYRLPDSALSALSLGHDPIGVETSPTLILSDPRPYQVHQRNGSSQATLRISGCWTGGAPTPSDIQYNWNNAGWNNLSATVDATNKTFTGTATITQTAATPAGRQGTLQLRMANATTVIASVPYVGIGDVWPVWGQSNADGVYTNYQPYKPATNTGLAAGLFGFDYNLGIMADSTCIAGALAWLDGSSESGDYGSLWPRLAALRADRTGYPQMFVPVAVAGTQIGATDGSEVPGWAPTNTANIGRMRLFQNYDCLRRRIQFLPSAPGGTSVAAAIGMQGEQDAGNNVSAGTYTTAIEALADQLFTDCAVVLINSRLQKSNGSYTELQAAAIRTGVDNAGTGDSAHFQVGADLSGLTADVGAHFALEATCATVAGLWDARLAALGY